MNLPTIIVLSIVVLVFLAIVIKQIRDKKAGKCSCSCGGSCGGCAFSGTCHANTEK